MDAPAMMVAVLIAAFAAGATLGPCISARCAGIVLLAKAGLAG